MELLRPIYAYVRNTYAQNAGLSVAKVSAEFTKKIHLSTQTKFNG